MRACVLTNKNEIEYKEIETPKIKEDELLIEIKACGICSSDFNRVFGDSAYFYPLVLGHEFAGKITKCGNRIDDKKYLNKKAVIFPLLPCFECEYCKQKSYAQCKNYKYFGSRCNGAMAEYIAVPEWNIKLLPDDMPFEIGALSEPTAVAVNAISKVSNLDITKDVCICGSGVIGIICGIIAKSRGANVTFLVRNVQKKEFLSKLGFENYIEENSDNKQYDIVFECVGSNKSINNCLKLVKAKGEIIFVGNPEGDILFEKGNYWKILRSELTVKGVWNSHFKNSENDDWDKAIEFLYKNQKEVCGLITDKFKLSDGIKAFETMRDKSQIHVKGVFVNEE